MIITAGITGTQKGGTSQQLSTFHRLIKHCTTYRGGMCIGVDEQTATIAKSYGLLVFGHPCDIQRKTTKDLSVYDHIGDVKPPLVRNTDIATLSDVGIALPREASEVLRSGTWSTIRRFRNMKKPLAIIWPDGSVSFERGAFNLLVGKDLPLHLVRLV